MCPLMEIYPWEGKISTKTLRMIPHCHKHPKLWEFFLGVFSQDQHSSGTKPITTRNQWEKLGKVSHFYQPPFFWGKKKNHFVLSRAPCWISGIVVFSPQLWKKLNHQILAAPGKKNTKLHVSGFSCRSSGLSYTPFCCGFCFVIVQREKTWQKSASPVHQLNCKRNPMKPTVVTSDYRMRYHFVNSVLCGCIATLPVVPS